MIIPWFEKLILRYAAEISSAGQAIYKFDEKIAEILDKKPIQEWEADRWWRGIKTRLIKENGHFFRVGTGKNSALSLFVRNEAGMNVGFRRESITQMATFVSLVTDFGFPRHRVYFESRWMDVVVSDDEGEALIYAENKASESVLKKLCLRLESDFAEDVPYVSEEEMEGGVKIDDALMKANHIFRNRPRYFWGVSPTFRQGYSIDYFGGGFSLKPAEIPASYQYHPPEPTAFEMLS